MKLLYDLVHDNISKEPKAMKILSSGTNELLSGLMSDNIQKFLLDNIETPAQIIYKDVPNMAPPYEEMWFEWKSYDGIFPRLGVHVHIAKQNMTGGWNYRLAVHVETQQGAAMLPYVTAFSIPPSGRTASLLYRYFPAEPELESEQHLNTCIPVLGACAGMVLFAIGLLHCKNVVSIEKGGKNPNIKNRRHRSKGTKHYVLDVVPARNIKRTEYEHPINGSPQRIHFRRGHFKEYTMDKPLFGKYVGTFWWEAHVAGSKDIGEIKKDYRILPMQK
jgi:hypothetical protein